MYLTIILETNRARTKIFNFLMGKNQLIH